VLVDQNDVANGWATPLPRDTIAIYAVWPSGSDELKTDDWLRLAVTHEFTHVVHLDRSEGAMRLVRNILGRHPLALPNVFLPIWQIEGLAVYEESVITGEGRLHAGDFRAIVDEAARTSHLLPLDRVNGGLTRWPAGRAPYAYGLSFHAFLAQHYGTAALPALADATSRYFPFFGSLAFKNVFGRSLSVLWRDFEADAMVSTPPAAGSANATRLTHHNFEVVGPRVAMPTCGDCPPIVYYSLRNQDELPALYRLPLGTTAGEPERVVTRMFGSTLAPGESRIYFDQQEIRRNTGLYSDLYSLDPRTRRVRQLTHGGRFIDPDLSPDRRRLVAIRIRPGRRDLVVFRVTTPDALSTPSVLLEGEETQFNAPRWSPDGHAIVVERQRTGERPEIVLVDPDSRRLDVIASESDTRFATPTWRPDGSAIVASAAVGDAPFHLVEIDQATRAIRQLTHGAGETWPDVLPDGKSIVYVGYTVDGFELFRMPYPVTQPTSSTHVASSQPGSSAADMLPGDVSSVSRPYSPLPTILPTWWTPVFGFADQQPLVGAATAGGDILGYHTYAASVSWRSGALDNAPPPRMPIDWDIGYAYSRWRSPLFVSVSKSTSFYPASTGAERPPFTREERTLEAGVALPVVHMRTRQTAVASFIRGQNDFTIADGGDELSRTRAAARFGWSLTNAHVFGNSISPERGGSIGLTAELVRTAIGADADATSIGLDGRAYVPGLGRHQVLAFRFAGGFTRGDPTVGRVFTLGGSANPGLIDFGGEALRLLRGFGVNSFAGTHIVSGSIEYRFPIAQPERGIGPVPFFLRTVHASVFADVGNVWTATFVSRAAKTSLGAEGSAKIVLGYVTPLTLTIGAARGHDVSGLLSDRTTVYGRVGFAF
jgi:hypothetical protein